MKKVLLLPFDIKQMERFNYHRPLTYRTLLRVVLSVANIRVTDITST